MSRKFSISYLFYKAGLSRHLPTLPSTRPVINLKPVELTSDCNMSMVRAWKRQFGAYYVISNMRNLSASSQHAFLLKNVDSTLSRRLTLATTETTPILPHDAGLSCFDVIDEYFQEMCPVLIRRQDFFSCCQNEGEGNSRFRDRLRALADNGDIIGRNLKTSYVFNIFKASEITSFAKS